MGPGRFDEHRLGWWLGRALFLSLVMVLGLVVLAMGVGPEGVSTAARDLLQVGSAPVVFSALGLSLLLVGVWESVG